MNNLIVEPKGMAIRIFYSEVCALAGRSPALEADRTGQFRTTSGWIPGIRCKAAHSAANHRHCAMVRAVRRSGHLAHPPGRVLI